MQDTHLRDSLGNAIARLFRHVNRAHNRALRPHRLSAEQVHILSLLWIEGAMPIGRLQRMLAVSSATITGSVDRMEKAELVRRVPDPKDRRSVIVQPAPFDKRKRRTIERTVLGTEDELFGVLTGTERKQLLRLMQKLITGLDV